MRRILQSFFTMFACVMASAAVRPPTDQCELTSLQPAPGGFKASWTRTNELVTPVAHTSYEALVSFAAKVSKRKTVAGDAESKRADNGQTGPPVQVHHLFLYQAQAGRGSRSGGGGTREPMALARRVGLVAREPVIAEDFDGTSHVIVWVEDRPARRTAYVAFDRKDGVERVPEPVFEVQWEVQEIAIAWDGREHLVVFKVLRPVTDKADADIYGVRLDRSLAKADREPRPIPGSRYGGNVFTAGNDGSFAIAWDMGTPNIVIMDSSGKLSAPIDLHPEVSARWKTKR